MESLLSADDGKTNMLKLTSKHLCRMYPGGHRVDSSNYDPQEAWSAGMQLVALNVQVGGITRSTLLALACSLHCLLVSRLKGADKSLWINQGRFLGNGGCG